MLLIKNHPTLKKDPVSGAFVNIDVSGINRARESYSLAKERENTINILQERMSKLECMFEKFNKAT